jgi:hypothetical protein
MSHNSFLQQEKIIRTSSPPAGGIPSENSIIAKLSPNTHFFQLHILFIMFRQLVILTVDAPVDNTLLPISMKKLTR